MVEDSVSPVEEKHPDEIKFIEDLCGRTCLLPFKAENGNHLIVVNMKNCAESFTKKSEEYFSDNKKFKLHIIGEKFYLEVLNGESFFDAYHG